MKKKPKIYRVIFGNFVRASTDLIGAKMKNGCWYLTRDGSRIALFPFGKKLAVESAKALAKLTAPSRLITYHRSGRIHAEFTYPKSVDPKISRTGK